MRQREAPFATEAPQLHARLGGRLRSLARDARRAMRPSRAARASSRPSRHDRVAEVEPILVTHIARDELDDPAIVQLRSDRSRRPLSWRAACRRGESAALALRREARAQYTRPSTVMSPTRSPRFQPHARPGPRTAPARRSSLRSRACPRASSPPHRPPGSRSAAPPGPLRAPAAEPPWRWPSRRWT